MSKVEIEFAALEELIRDSGESQSLKQFVRQFKRVRRGENSTGRT